ncbi:hypothetical protein NKJ26_03315 [Mesorhizobium sp. M0152]|uniref:hypothetical protein n=1 Tax=Mesorhizobium sp. M0152 TaxID=2956898 RepID=UPI003334C1F4
MSKIVTFWDAVVAEIDTRVPALKEVRKYANEFDEGDKGRIGIKTPGALVAVTGNGVSTKLPDGRLKLNVAVAVAIIAEERGKTVDTTAAEIAEAVVGVIHENRFRVDDMPTARSDPDAISIVNYNSDKTLGRGISVWGVGWEQAIIVGTATFVEPPLPNVPNGGYQPAELTGDTP